MRSITEAFEYAKQMLRDRAAKIERLRLALQELNRATRQAREAIAEKQSDDRAPE